MNILLVEDSESDRISLIRSLKKESIEFTLYEFESGEKAMLFLKDTEVELDLIVSDNGLPGMSGFDFLLELIRSGNQTPKILLTGSGSIQVAVAALKIGVSDYIIKDSHGDYLHIMPLIFLEVVKANQNKLENEKARADLISSQSRFENLIQNSSDIIQIMGQSGNIIFVNKSWKDSLGYSDQDILSMNFYDLIHQSAFESSKRIISEIILKKLDDTHIIETVLVKKNGEQIIVEGSINYQVSKENIVTVLSIFRDITSRKKSEKALIEAKEKSEAAGKFKSEFLANMSHDLRTPLNGIIGFTDLLLQEDLPSENKKFIEMIKSSGELLLMLVNDILDFSKIEAGELSILKTPEKLEDVLKETVSTAKMYMIQKVKNVEIRENYLADTSAHYLIDSFRIKQILNNLLSNAIKFTNTGYIEIGVSFLENSILKFYVQDTGVGIPEESQKKLFAPYQQANDLISRNYGGTGLGLAISRKLVKLMDGDIDMISTSHEIYHRTMFYFSIPTVMIEKNKISTPTNKTGYITEKPKTGTTVNHNKFLVAEDNPVNQMLIKILLEKLGYIVDIAENGKIVCDKYSESSDYDIIFMDMQMPVMDGVEATTRIRMMEKENKKIKKIPIIALTASVLTADREKCLAAGCNSFLTKPINRGQLLETISSYLG